MRLAYILSFFFVLGFTSSCKDKTHVFYSQTDVAKRGLKGKVRSVAEYHCTLDSSAEYCSVTRRKYNDQGFITETIDTSGQTVWTYKFFYNGDGLLVKQVFTSKFLVPLELGGYIAPWEETYTYSIPERKRTAVFREDRHGDFSIDTIVTFYDKNGNEIQRRCKTFKSFNEYDENGFLVLERTIFRDHPQDTSEVRYSRDTKGRPVKIKWANETTQTAVYDKNGQIVQKTTFNKSGKKEWDSFIGYCGFDEKGNHLKSIWMSPQTKSMGVDSMIIEYY